MALPLSLRPHFCAVSERDRYSLSCTDVHHFYVRVPPASCLKLVWSVRRSGKSAAYCLMETYFCIDCIRVFSVSAITLSQVSSKVSQHLHTHTHTVTDSDTRVTRRHNWSLDTALSLSATHSHVSRHSTSHSINTHSAQGAS